MEFDIQNLKFRDWLGITVENAMDTKIALSCSTAEEHGRKIDGGARDKEIAKLKKKGKQLTSAVVKLLLEE